jgi:hypothetical protein
VTPEVEGPGLPVEFSKCSADPLAKCPNVLKGFACGMAHYFENYLLNLPALFVLTDIGVFSIG